MKHIMLTLLAFTLPLVAKEDWSPTKDPAKANELTTNRTLDVYHHGVKPAWGYAAPQQDTFVVMHPKAPRKQAPLYVVLHSAGHDVISCVKCTRTVGNHDIYHAPDDFFALYLDCRANKNDWWWGGMHVKDAKLMERNAGGDPMPAERRVIDTVKWVMKTYGIDPNRVYLCGNSMGGSGALGIGLPNGDLFAAVKANVPAGIEHVSQRMYFPPHKIPDDRRIPDPPVVIDYSGTNDGWSVGHDPFAQAMRERKYAFYFYWGPFGHANNHANIMKVNDLINSFDWLDIKLNEAYAVFTNASCDDALPWPDKRDDKKPGQLNAFFRWKVLGDAPDALKASLFLVSQDQLETKFEIPAKATADVTFRRIQQMEIQSGDKIHWTYGEAKGIVTADTAGIVTIPGLKILQDPTTLTISR